MSPRSSSADTTAALLLPLVDHLVDLIADRVAERLAERQRDVSSTVSYSSDPRHLQLPAGWTKRTWDDRSRLPKEDPRRLPTLRAPRGWTCSKAAFDEWQAKQTGRARHANKKPKHDADTDVDRAVAAAGIVMTKPRRRS